MCARRPTSAMPKPFLCCERAFCCSMVVMWPVLMHVMSFDVVVMSFDAMWLLMLCHVTWCNAMSCDVRSCDVPCNGHVVCSKWFCDSVVIQSTILYYKVLLCTTKYYSSTTLHYKVREGAVTTGKTGDFIPDMYWANPCQTSTYPWHYKSKPRLITPC